MLGNDNNDLDALRQQISQLKTEVTKKTNENVINQQKIATLEDEIIKLRELLPDSKSKKKGKKVKETKLILDLEAKQSEIRQLKDRMGFLRKEKIDVQKELEKFKEKNKKNSRVLRVEDIREEKPLNLLVKDLQEKIKKQESIIKQLGKDGSLKDFEEKLTHKDAIIESFNEKIAELNHKLQKIETQGETTPNGGIHKKLLEDLQKKLNRLKRQNTDLKSKLEMYKKQDSKDHQMDYESKIRDLETTIEELNKRLTQKGTGDIRRDDALDQVVEDLQSKLNKSKNQIKILQEQLASVKNHHSSSDPNEQLKIQRDMAIFLQNQLDDAKRALKTKVEEIGTIKNEAIRIKRKYEELENQMKLKEQRYSELHDEYESLKIQSQLQVNPQSTQKSQIDLVIQELKSQIEDLTKQNIQQRLEIHQLRKSA